MKFITILWHENRKLALGLLFFVLGQCFFTYKGVETVPFFNYGMYSAPSNKMPVVLHTQVCANNKPILLDDLPYRSTAFLQYQVRHQQKLLQQKGIDHTFYTIQNRFGRNSHISDYLFKYLCSSPIDTLNFNQWFGDYIGRDNISLQVSKYKWSNGKLSPIK